MCNESEREREDTFAAASWCTVTLCHAKPVLGKVRPVCFVHTLLAGGSPVAAFHCDTSLVANTISSLLTHPLCVCVCVCVSVFVALSHTITLLCMKKKTHTHTHLLIPSTKTILCEHTHTNKPFIYLLTEIQTNKSNKQKQKHSLVPGVYSILQKCVQTPSTLAFAGKSLNTRTNKKKQKLSFNKCVTIVWDSESAQMGGKPSPVNEYMGITLGNTVRITAKITS